MPHIAGIEKKGKRYFAHLDFKNKRYTPGRGFSNAEEASKWRATKRNELQRGIGLGSDVAFYDFALQYYKQYKESGKSPSTINTTETLIRVSLIPGFGSKRIRDLTVDHIARFRGEMLARYSPKTAIEIMGLLKRILDRAIKLDIILKNPARYVEPIQRKRKEPTTLSPDQLMRLLSSSPPTAKTIIALGGLAGLRRSEVFGLMWTDIDFEANTITVNRQHWQNIIKEPKTRVSRCTLPMLDELSAILREWKLQCGSQTWLFPGYGGRPLNSTWLYENFRPLLLKCGLPNIRFHDLRHTFITILLNKGIPIIDVKYLARHSTVTITEQYAHRTPGHLEDVVKATKIFEDGLYRMERRITKEKSA